MSEQKRATLSTITTQKTSVKKFKDTTKTVRFTLTLPESNEKACPEYNYRDLLNSVEKKKIKDKNPPPTNGLNVLDPFDENDDDVKRIARQFEEKYGMQKPARRKGKKDDYADIGAGYDESDSFIDNTDAYDEMVPRGVTTLHGGFYINSGALEFKQEEPSASEDSSDSEPEKTVKRNKRVIEDSEESESDEEESEKEKEATKNDKIDNPEKKQKVDKVETNGVPKPAKKKLILDDKEHVVKKKKVEDNNVKKKTLTVKELIKEKREEFNLTQEALELGIEKDKSRPGSINATIESVVNASRTDNVDETSKDSTSTDDVTIVSAASSESESSRDGAPPSKSNDNDNPTDNKIDTESVTKLPEKLPNEVYVLINDIKKAAVENSVGKVKFFTDSVNNMLLKLEIQCRKLGKNNRNQVYEHLAPFVKCKKDTLMRRAKNLVLDNERSKMKEPLKKLKLVIENLMPKMRKVYEREVQKTKEELFVSNTDATDPNKLKKLPKKRFIWTEEAKQLLKEIVIIKKKCYMLEGIRKETFEDHLETFLKIGVICLWPEGWMNISTLMKQVKILMENKNEAVQKATSTPLPMSPISIDTAPASLSSKSIASPTASSISGITVIPIPNPSKTSPTAVSASTSVPKTKSITSVKQSEISVTKVADLTVNAPSPIEITEIPSSNQGNSIQNSPSTQNSNIGVRDQTSTHGVRDLSTSHGARDLSSNYGVRDPSSSHGGREQTSSHTGRDQTSSHTGRDQTSSHTVRDQITGHSGRDQITGHSGRDQITGHSGRDQISSHSGRDQSSSHGRDQNSNHGSRDQNSSHGVRDQTHGIRDQSSSLGVRDQSSNHGIRDQISSHGVRDQSSSHGMREQSSNHEMRDQGSSHGTAHQSGASHGTSHKSSSHGTHQSSTHGTSHPSSLLAVSHLTSTLESSITHSTSPHGTSESSNRGRSHSSSPHRTSLPTSTHGSSHPIHGSSDSRRSSNQTTSHNAHQSSSHGTSHQSSSHGTSHQSSSHGTSHQSSSHGTSHQSSSHGTSHHSSSHGSSLHGSSHQTSHSSSTHGSSHHGSSHPISHSISTLAASHSSSNHPSSHSSSHGTSSKSNVTIQSVDLRTNNYNNESVLVTSELNKSATSIPVSSNEKVKSKQSSEVITDGNFKDDDDCQIIDLTESSTSVVKKPGPKSKTEYTKQTVKPVKHSETTKRAEETPVIQRKPEETIEKSSYKEQLSNEDEMEEVMKNLKELQEMQGHVRKYDLDSLMAPSSSPVSVIAYNSSFSPSKTAQPSDLTTKKLDGPGFQEIFQKHLFQESTYSMKPAQSSSVYNLQQTNYQTTNKNNYNSIDNYNYSRTGSSTNLYNNHMKYQQSGNKYNSNLGHIQSNPPGTTNHTDDFAMFSNLLYQYGYHNTTGSKQKSPP